MILYVFMPDFFILATNIGGNIATIAWLVSAFAVSDGMGQWISSCLYHKASIKVLLVTSCVISITGSILIMSAAENVETRTIVDGEIDTEAFTFLLSGRACQGFSLGSMLFV